MMALHPYKAKRYLFTAKQEKPSAPLFQLGWDRQTDVDFLKISQLID